jgi:hypothetical protein
MAKKTGQTRRGDRRQRRAENPARRFGNDRGVRARSALSCARRRRATSTGQNIVLDGGAYPGTL